MQTLTETARTKPKSLLPTASGAGRLKVGFAGAGGVSSKHAQILALLPDVDLISVCDVVRSRAERLAREFHVPGVFSSLEEMLRSTDLDVVHVLTPPDLHLDVALECLRCGHHVFIEKPLATSLAGCKKLKAESLSRGLLCGVNHNTAHLPAIDRLIEVVKARRLGRLDHVTMNICFPREEPYVLGFTPLRFHPLINSSIYPEFLPFSNPDSFVFREPASILYEFGPHAFSVIHRLMGRVIAAECVASGERKLAGGKKLFDSWQIALVCERGTATVCLLIGRGIADASVRLLGEDGLVQAELDSGIIRIATTSPHPLTRHLHEALIHSASAFHTCLANLWHHVQKPNPQCIRHSPDPFVRSIYNYYEAIRGNTPLQEDADSGTAVVEYCEKSAKSVRYSCIREECLADVAS